ncbi:MAG: replicative DNA helicase [Coriobacteriales bacterium]|nr:replicative DNA helicase [Coriobacteriales bacterium]
MAGNNKSTVQSKNVTENSTDYLASYGNYSYNENNQVITKQAPSDSNTKEIPHDLEAEKSVLAAMISSPEILQDALLFLKPESFFRPSHKILFETMQALFQENIPIDYINLTDRLESQQQLEAVGGQDYIMDLNSNQFSIYNWQSHAEIVKKTYVLRELIFATARVSSLAYNAPFDSNDVVFECEKLILDVTREQVKSGFKKLDDLTIETYNELQAIKKEGRKHLGVSSGYAALDRVLGGFRPGNLVVLAARPGVGKTSFALNIALRTAQKQDTKVALFSLEMSATELVQRFLSMDAQVSSQKISEANLSTEQWKRIARSSNKFKKIDIFLDDTPAANIIEISTKARRQMRGVEPGKGLIIVDYLQLMQPTTHHADARHVEVAEISRGLKILAKELNQPIIALSQLNRAVEARKDRKPMLADLRESGAIEQDADVVMFIDRSFTDEEANDEKRPDKNIAEIIIAKHRNGETGTVELFFNPLYTLFKNLTRKDEEERAAQYEGGEYIQQGEAGEFSQDPDDSSGDDEPFS